MGTISCRYSAKFSNSVDKDYPNFDVREDENGQREFIEKEVVAPALASDFQVLTNALYRGIK